MLSYNPTEPKPKLYFLLSLPINILVFFISDAHVYVSLNYKLTDLDTAYNICIENN